MTPHNVCLAWMKDLLELWSAAGWGWSMWNLRGTFGILDSGRTDVAYESFRGHQLDRVVARRRMKAKPRSIACTQRDLRGAGVNHELDPPAIHSCINLEVAALTSPDYGVA